MKKISLILAAAIFILSCCYLYEIVNTHLWVRVNDAKIMVGNELSLSSDIYKSCDANYLVAIRRYGRVRYYLVDPHALDISLPNDNFFYVSGNIVSRFYPPNAGPYGKTGRQPCLKIHGNIIEFMDNTDRVSIEMMRKP